MDEEININYDDYTDVVNQESVENIMKAMGHNLVGNDFIIRDYVIDTFGYRVSSTKNKDIINAIMTYESGFRCGKGLRPRRSPTYITEDGAEWSYDSQANMDIIDDILEHASFNVLMTASDSVDNKYLMAVDKTRSYCLDLMSKRKYTARIMKEIADAYFEGYYNCLIEKKE